MGYDIVGLLKSKTFWLALAAIVAAIAGYFNQTITLPEMIAAIVAAVQSINIKDGQLKVVKAVEAGK